MSGFWEKALGGPPAPQEAPQAQQPAAPAASRAWWRGDQPVAPQQAAAPQGYQVPEDELRGHDLSKATHLKQSTGCPECGGANVATTGKVTTKHGVVESRRCFDCGWPLVQSTSGMSGVSGGRADAASRQVATGGAVTSNYQPQNTIAGAIRTQADLR